MSVAFQTNTNRIRHSDFAQPMWIYNSSSSAADDHHRKNEKFPLVKDQEEHDSSSSSSSIGNNSDDDASGGGAGDSDDDGGEVQSLFKGPLNTLCALEEALPIKRGISTFYAGKSKSYTSLADAVSVPSIQDIVKPEDAYNRKRKNMIAHSVLLDKNRNFASKNNGMISKRFANSNRGGTLGLGLNKHDSNSVGESSTLSSSPGCSLPPLPARPRRLPTNESTDSSSPRIYCSTWRSLSLSDLQNAAGTTSNITGSLSKKRVEEQEDD
ncbi:hypothetical protein OSB04_031150 [Centaurea solstitialis]|uniref:Uncharacterized protein n=1 Tax=Centaurea solstitialis TaxID=347529 RepID=A0AA38VU11_9ASTR|nr:hypothetical protein OSB04_031150 [Centaurea solstitialis]